MKKIHLWWQLPLVMVCCAPSSSVSSQSLVIGCNLKDKNSPKVCEVAEEKLWKMNEDSIKWISKQGSCPSITLTLRSCCIDLCTNVRITAHNKSCLWTCHSYFVQHSGGRNTGSYFTIIFIRSGMSSALVLGLVTVPSIEADSRCGGAAGVFCCLSVSADRTGHRASLEDPADVKQLPQHDVMTVWLTILWSVHYHLQL